MNNQVKEKFTQFDFAANTQWLDFISQMDKSLPVEQINKLKTHWYKDNIDPSYIIEDTPHVHSQKCDHHFMPQPSSQHTQTSYQNLSIIQKGFYDAENFLKLGFLVGAILRLSFTNSICYAVCFLALYRQLKRPHWNKQYGRKFFMNEFFHNIVYLFVFFFFTQYMNFVFYFPLLIHFWVGLCEYLNLKQGFMYQKLKKYVDATRQQKEQLMDMKNKIEIYLFPIIIGLIFVGMSSLYLAFFYSNFLRIKYTLNNRLQQQFADVNTRYLERLKKASPRPIQYIVTKFQQFCAYLVKIK